MGKKEANTQECKKREVGLQSIIQPKMYDSPHITAQKNLEIIEYNRLFYISHTLIFLGLGILSMNLFINYTRDLDLYETQVLAVKAICFFVLMFSAFYMPDTIVTRPHPFIWRMVMGANLIYACFLVYMSFLPLEEAQKTLTIFDENLGKPLPEKNYADDCRIYTPEDPVSVVRNLKDSIDVHFVAHLLGWMVKVLIMRDIKLCWVCSVIFELTELTFRHWLPNFAECWWDHLLLDLFGCNMVGIIIGACFLKYASVKKLHWIYQKEKTTENFLYNECSAINRAALKLKPQFFMQHDWEVFKSLKRFYGVLIYICICIGVDLDNFFMKAILHVPANHDLLKYRLMLWCPLAIAGSEEYFEYLTNKYSVRVRPFMWLIFLNLSLEIGIIIRHSYVYTGEPFPLFVKVMWSIIGLTIVGITIFIIVTKKRKPKGKKPWNPYDPPMDIKAVDY